MKKQAIRRWVMLALLAALCGCQSKTSSSSSGSDSSSNSQPAPPPPPAPVVVDAGTTLTVTVDQDLSTKTNAPGERFAASLAEPVTVNGTVVLPAGTKATGTITESKEAGHIKGGAALSITLDSLMVNGNKYSIETSTYAQTGKGRGKRTAVGAGGGAAVGAIIGALAGGGKGAGIGALAGGGAGTAGAAYTGKRDLSIPAETRVHFKLLKPLNVSQ